MFCAFAYLVFHERSIHDCSRCVIPSPRHLTSPTSEINWVLVSLSYNQFSPSYYERRRVVTQNMPRGTREVDTFLQVSRTPTRGRLYFLISPLMTYFALVFACFSFACVFHVLRDPRTYYFAADCCYHT